MCPFSKSTKGMVNGCYDYGGSLENVLSCKGFLAPKSLRTPAVLYVLTLQYITFTYNGSDEQSGPSRAEEP